MESNLNEEKVTVQSLINSVPAASGGEQTGPQSSSSSDCTQPISEVGNLASVIENVSRSNENEEIVSTGQETDTYNSLNNETETAEISLQSETNKKDRESPLLVENNETHTTNVVNETEDSKENIEESSSQHEPNENDEESVASNLIQLEDTANNMNVAVGMEDSMESITHSQPDINSEKMITNSSTQIKDTAKKRLSGAQRRKLKKMAMKRQKRQAAQAINNNNNMNDSISMDDNTKSIKENTLQPEANKNDKESQSYNPIYNKAKSPLLAQTITNETITVDDNKESINESSLQAQPNENSEESLTNKDNTQVMDKTQVDNNTDTIKRRLSGAQRRKLRKLEMMQRERPQDSQPHLQRTTTYSEMDSRRLIHIQYATMKESKITHPKVVVGFFPNSLDDTNDKILSFIQWQNEGLSVFAWKLLRRTSRNSTIMLTLLIDKMSAVKLEEVKGEIFYKFRQIKLHMRDYEEKRDHATNCTESMPKQAPPAKMSRINQ